MKLAKSMTKEEVQKALEDLHDLFMSVFKLRDKLVEEEGLTIVWVYSDFGAKQTDFDLEKVLEHCYLKAGRQIDQYFDTEAKAEEDLAQRRALKLKCSSRI